MAEQIEYVFINGLGDGEAKWHERLSLWRWKAGGTELHHVPANWYEDRPFEEFHAGIVEQVEQIAQQTGRVAVIGSSAGASEAVNVFHELKDRVNICAITAHGRLADGGYPDEHKMSVHRRARIGQEQASQLFADSLKYLEEVSIPALADDEKSRIYILTQLTDMVVPMDTTLIDGVGYHRSIAFGHSGGFLAHFLADKGIIEGFAEKALS